MYKPKKKQTPGSSAHKVVNDYNFERKAVDMKKFLDAQMPDFAEKIKDPNDLTKFENKANRNQLPQVLLFSSKPNTSPLTKYLSTEFRRRMLLAEVKPNKKNEAVLEKYGITSLPAIVVVPPGDAAPIQYEGEGFTRNKLHGFLANHVLKDPVLTVKKKEDTTDTTEQQSAGEEAKTTTKESGNEEEPKKQKVHSSEL